MRAPKELEPIQRARFEWCRGLTAQSRNHLAVVLHGLVHVSTCNSSFVMLGTPYKYFFSVHSSLWTFALFHLLWLLVFSMLDYINVESLREVPTELDVHCLVNYRTYQRQWNSGRPQYFVVEFCIRSGLSLVAGLLHFKTRSCLIKTRTLQIQSMEVLCRKHPEREQYSHSNHTAFPHYAYKSLTKHKYELILGSHGEEVFRNILDNPFVKYFQIGMHIYWLSLHCTLKREPLLDHNCYVLPPSGKNDNEKQTSCKIM